MTFALTDLRTDLAALLGSAVDSETWSDDLLDEGCRQALQFYNLMGPIYETSLSVTTAGHEQDVSAIAGLVTVEGVAWPWFDGALFEDEAMRWRMVAPTTLRLDRHAPAVGDLLRIRYRKAHTVSALDGAATTTVVDAHRGALVLGAAAQVLTIRIRQISENPALPRETPLLLADLRDDLQQAFARRMALCEGGRAPAWVRMGL